MGFDREKIKQIKGLILFVAVLVFLLIYSKEALEVVLLGFSIIKPFLIGGVIAFILNIPLCGIEKKLLVRWKGKTADSLKRTVSIVLSILFVVFLITVVVMTVTPQIGKTAIELGNKVPVFAQKVVKDLEDVSVNYPQIQKYVEKLETVEINWESITAKVVDFLRNGMTSMLSSTVNVASSIIGAIVNAVIAFIFAIYILGQKEKLGGQCKRILSAYVPDRVNEYVLKVCSLLYRNFSKFISGQCLEAVILGSMFAIAMTIFRMPYAIMVGVLIAFTALIPIVGAFIGCAVGAFLIMVDDPVKAIWFIILFLVIQQIEGNLIYPKVVGNSVGLPPIWVLAAVSIGGSLFGVSGMLFFIPLVSTVYVLLRDSVNERNRKKAISCSESSYTKICITNRHLVSGDFIKQIENILKSKEKPDILILREKDMTEGDYKALAYKVMNLCSRYNTRCILHKFKGAAESIGAKALHLCMADFEKMTEDDKLKFETIGVSVHSVEEAVRAQSLGASYIMAGHVFETDCKKGVKPRGIEFLKEICSEVSIPVYAVGGINKENAASCKSAGAAGVCMMSVFMKM